MLFLSVCLSRRPTQIPFLSTHFGRAEHQGLRKGRRGHMASNMPIFWSRPSSRLFYFDYPPPPPYSLTLTLSRLLARSRSFSRSLSHARTDTRTHTQTHTHTRISLSRSLCLVLALATPLSLAHARTQTHACTQPHPPLTHAHTPNIRTGHRAAIWKVEWAHPEFGQVLASCCNMALLRLY